MIRYPILPFCSCSKRTCEDLMLSTEGQEKLEKKGQQSDPETPIRIATPVRQNTYLVS